MYLRTCTMYRPLSLIPTSTPSISDFLASFFNHSILQSSSKSCPPFPTHLWSLPSVCRLPRDRAPILPREEQFLTVSFEAWMKSWIQPLLLEIPSISTHFVTIFYVPYNIPIGLSHCWLQEQTMEQQERPCDVLVQLQLAYLESLVLKQFVTLHYQKLVYFN